jgi:Zn-dependent protease with chaperone function
VILIIPLVGALALLGLPGWSGAWGRRLPAREWARLVSGSLAVGAAALGISLLLIAAPTLLAAAGLPRVAAWCLRMLGGLAPGGPAVGWTAAGVAVLVAVLGWGAVRRTTRVRRAVHESGFLSEATRLRGVEVLLLPATEPVAMTVAGRVAVSRGLVEALSADQLEAVLRHEEAHVRHRHHRWLLLGRALGGALAWLPFLRRSLEVHALALERWADEEAAPTPGGRRALREALLVAVGIGEVAVPALATAETVLERLRALESGPPAPASLERALLYVPVAAVGGGAMGSLVLWVGQAQALLSAAGLCLV